MITKITYPITRTSLLFMVCNQKWRHAKIRSLLRIWLLIFKDFKGLGETSKKLNILTM